MKQLPDYTLIDQKATGARLKSAIRASGYRVCEIQEFLSLSCPQPIYRWFRGEVLPSLHHLYALSGLLDVPMDDLLVQEKPCATACDPYTAFLSQEKLQQGGTLTGTAACDLSITLSCSTEKRIEILNHTSLRIDFEKIGNNSCASGMYGVALLAQRCISRKNLPTTEYKRAG